MTDTDDSARNLFFSNQYTLPVELLDKLSAIDGGKWKRIAFELASRWGTVDGEKYITNLLIDDRPGHRQGFPIEVIGLLTEIALLHPLTTKQDLWDNRDYK
jgi:hypothetical protein